MNKREITMIIITACAFLAVLFGFYLPRRLAVKELQAAIAGKEKEIVHLEGFIPEKPFEEARLAGVVVESEKLENLMTQEFNSSLATGELVRLCRDTGGITIDSIIEMGDMRTVEADIRKWLIKIYLQASFYDFARLLHGLNGSELPLAVESFIIAKEENHSSLSKIELTVAICVFQARKQ